MRCLIALVAMLLASAARAQSPDISAGRLLSSWHDNDPNMRIVAEMIAGAFAGGFSWGSETAGKRIYCAPPDLKGRRPGGQLTVTPMVHPLQKSRLLLPASVLWLDLLFLTFAGRAHCRGDRLRSVSQGDPAPAALGGRANLRQYSAVDRDEGRAFRGARTARGFGARNTGVLQAAPLDRFACSPLGRSKAGPRGRSHTHINELSINEISFQPVQTRNVVITRTKRLAVNSSRPGCAVGGKSKPLSDSGAAPTARKTIARKPAKTNRNAPPKRKANACWAARRPMTRPRPPCAQKLRGRAT
jgi:hypothetical protein